MTYQLEGATVDTYATAATENLDADDAFSTDKRRTDIGTWVYPKERILSILQGADAAAHYSDSPGSIATGWHVADLIYNPTDYQKTTNHKHILTNQNTYGDVAFVDPAVVNKLYVYMERNWYDCWFMANDNGQQQSSTYAHIMHFPGG